MASPLVADRPPDRDNDSLPPHSVPWIDRDSRPSSEPSESVTIQPKNTAGTSTSPGDPGRRLLSRSITGFTKARDFARDMLPNILRGRSSSSSAISPFEFNEDDFTSVFSNRDNDYNSSRGSSVRADSIELMFGPHISDAPANFHVRNNRALAELMANGSGVSAADQLSLCTLVSSDKRTNFHNRVWPLQSLECVSI
ncbi:hypothetical protein FOZ63_010250 [Perkinsus olseni]|uniref:Uncharacterized protein n=1 Tax=Perkinsus olseni TaxID=32597 RepID=A0A7J6PKF4_PEROL|nr:hypothetical protein FOZ63_010250 [Perkinsus olseni]